MIEIAGRDGGKAVCELIWLAGQTSSEGVRRGVLALRYWGGANSSPNLGSPHPSARDAERQTWKSSGQFRFRGGASFPSMTR